MKRSTLFTRSQCLFYDNFHDMETDPQTLSVKIIRKVEKLSKTANKVEPGRQGVLTSAEIHTVMARFEQQIVSQSGA